MGLIRLAIIPLLLPVILYIHNRLSLFGVYRNPTARAQDYAKDNHTFIIPNLNHCEDIEYVAELGKIYAACQGNVKSRYGWWPAWNVLDDPELGAKANGEIWEVDVKTWKTTKLAIQGFDPSAFTTIGIDTFYDPISPSDLYINVINLSPSPACFAPLGICKSSATIESFHVDPLSSPHTATHLRTFSHHSMHSPNNLVSLSPTEILVSNDHYLDNPHLRIIEDFIGHTWLSFTNVLKLDFGVGDGKGSVEKVLRGVHNANGLARGPNGLILLGDASGGVMNILTYNSTHHAPSLEFKHRIPVHTTIDNPHYYHDDQSNKSSYFLAGLTRGIDLSKNARNPDGLNPWIVHRLVQDEGVKGGWRKEVVLEDDGRWNAAGTKSVFVPHSGEGEDGAGWLVNSGIYCLGLGVVKIQLS